jgi:hypothetical protein
MIRLSRQWLRSHDGSRMRRCTQEVAAEIIDGTGWYVRCGRLLLPDTYNPKDIRLCSHDGLHMRRHANGRVSSGLCCT